MSTLVSPVRARCREWFHRVLPAACQLCGARADACAAYILCESCVHTLPPPAPQTCARCAAALPAAGQTLCGACAKSPPAFDASAAVFAYAFPVDRLIHLFKYQAHMGLATFFAQHAAHTLPRPQADALVPMPLHPARQAARGFNQSLELARALSRHWHIPLLADAVMRTQAGPPQVSLPLRQRRNNLRRAFAARRRLDGLRLLAVDDVMTTGASLHALAAELKRHGAAHVQCLVLARTAAHRRD